MLRYTSPTTGVICTTSQGDILSQGLMAGMAMVGEKFKTNEIFVPHVLVAARAMNMGAALLKPLLAADGVKATGKGLEVIDLGVDVPPESATR